VSLVLALKLASGSGNGSFGAPSALPAHFPFVLCPDWCWPNRFSFLRATWLHPCRQRFHIRSIDFICWAISSN